MKRKKTFENFWKVCRRFAVGFQEIERLRYDGIDGYWLTQLSDLIDEFSWLISSNMFRRERERDNLMQSLKYEPYETDPLLLFIFVWSRNSPQ